MDIHEYQAKSLLSDFGMPIAKGGIAYSPEQAAYRAKELGGDLQVISDGLNTGARFMVRVPVDPVGDAAITA